MKFVADFNHPHRTNHIDFGAPFMFHLDDIKRSNTSYHELIPAKLMTIPLGPNVMGGSCTSQAYMGS